MITKEQLQKRADGLKAQIQKLTQQLAQAEKAIIEMRSNREAVNGALQDCGYWLQQLEAHKSEPEAPAIEADVKPSKLNGSAPHEPSAKNTLPAAHSGA